MEVQVVRLDMATRRVRRVELIAADGAPLPAFTAGAHVDLELPNGETRSYSLLNDQGETDRYVLGVLREDDSAGGSAYVHDHLRVGDRLKCSAPANDFALYEHGDANVLIAGGIGITPIMSMAARLKELGKDYRLHVCARAADDAAFLDELAARHGDRLTQHFDGGDPSRGIDLTSLLARRPPSGHVYVCGPTGLIKATVAATGDWPKGTVHYELFKGAAADIEPRNNDQPFDVVLKKTGRTIRVPADMSILAALKAEGIKIKTLCVSGRCGTCRVTYLSGRVEHRDDVLDDDEKDSVLQVCVSRAMAGETLVLDL